MNFLCCPAAGKVPSLFHRIAAQAIGTSTNQKPKIYAALRKSRFQLLAFCILLFFLTNSAQAVLLDNWIYQIDDQTYDSLYGDPDPTTGSLSEDDLGTLSLEITGAGAHNVVGFFDFEILREANTWWNEYGASSGTPGPGQSWEIDEPVLVGDIVDNALAGVLDNTNGVPSGWDDDVAFAMGWEFSLLDGDIATINYVFTDELPSVDFYLAQVDPDAAYQFYFYSELTIATAGGPPGPSPAPVPEPASTMLMLTGLLAAWTQRKRIGACENRKNAKPDKLTQ